MKSLRWLAWTLALACSDPGNDPDASTDGATDAPSDDAESDASSDVAIADSGADATPGAIDWECRWNNGTGTSDDAVLGTSERGEGVSRCFGGFTATTGELLEVVPVSEACGEWPSALTHTLRVTLNRNIEGSKMVEVVDAWPEPEVGGYLYYRSYDCNDMQPGDPANIHVQHGGAGRYGGAGYIWRWYFAGGQVEPDGSFPLDFGPSFNQNGMGFGQGRFQVQGGGGTRVGRTYLREIRGHRLSVDTMQWSVRITDVASGEVVLTERDYVCATSDTGGCIEHGFLVDRLGDFPVRIGDVRGLRALELGNNGSEGGDPDATRFWYWGGVAVRVSTSDDDWIGPIR